MSNPQLSQLARAYPASGIRTMFERAQTYSDVIKLTVGEPDFDTPDCIVEAAKAALDAHQTRYVSNAGIPELREAIAERYAARWSRPLTADNVLITVGAMEALLVAIQTVVDPGQEVLVASPGYPNYLGQILMAGAKGVPVPVTEANYFRLTSADVAAAITDRTAAILLNSPSNPLGSRIDPAELRSIVALARERDIMVISDEVYEAISYDGRPHVSAAEVALDLEHVIVVNSFSKAYAMTGWRCGWLIGPSDLVGVMQHLKEGITSCVAPFVQRAALAGLSCADEATDQMRTAFQHRRDLVLSGVEAIDGLSMIKPEGAFYAFINISRTGLSSADFALGLLDTERVCLVPGTAFGAEGEGFVRLSYAAKDEQLSEGLARMDRFVSRLTRVGEN